MGTSAVLSSITIYPELVRKIMCKFHDKFTGSHDGWYLTNANFDGGRTNSISVDFGKLHLTRNT